MENEKLTQFIVPIFLILGIILVLGFTVPKVIESVTQYRDVTEQINTKQQSVQEKEAKLAELKSKEQSEAAQEQANTESDKPFFKPVVGGMDTDAAIAGELEEILQLVRANKIKVRSIETFQDPSDDNFVKGAGSQYNVARLKMEMIANYVNYDNFLKELYKHEHFLDIESAEIVPYKKNKKILLINFHLKLYAKK